jgi:hypothetical protein
MFSFQISLKIFGKEIEPGAWPHGLNHPFEQTDTRLVEPQFRKTTA